MPKTESFTVFEARSFLSITEQMNRLGFPLGLLDESRLSQANLGLGPNASDEEVGSADAAAAWLNPEIVVDAWSHLNVAQRRILKRFTQGISALINFRTSQPETQFSLIMDADHQVSLKCGIVTETDASMTIKSEIGDLSLPHILEGTLRQLHLQMSQSFENYQKKLSPPVDA
jgi:hypothetical protein